MGYVHFVAPLRFLQVNIPATPTKQEIMSVSQTNMEKEMVSVREKRAHLQINGRQQQQRKTNGFI